MSDSRSYIKDALRAYATMDSEELRKEGHKNSVKVDGLSFNRPTLEQHKLLSIERTALTVCKTILAGKSNRLFLYSLLVTAVERVLFVKTCERVPYQSMTPSRRLHFITDEEINNVMSKLPIESKEAMEMLIEAYEGE